MTGEINPAVYNSLFFGNSVATGTPKVPIFNEPWTIPAVGSGPTSTALTQVGGVATATFATAHGFTPGEVFTSTGATPSGYNVVAQPVISVPTPTTLTYAVNPSTTSPASVQATFTGTNKLDVANQANFNMDLGVYNQTTGVRFQQVAGSPSAGQYSVSSGTYTFNSADAGTLIYINYIYNDVSNTTGETLTINNLLMGVAPTWQMVLTETFNNETFVLVLYSCTSSKLTFPFKLDDFTISELDFQAQANAANQIGYMSASIGTP